MSEWHRKVSYEDSLEARFPHIAAQWDYDRNGDLTPSEFTVGSNKKFWWRCDKGPDHRWDATVVNRTSGRTGCPCCSNKKVSVTNSLATKSPEVAAQWDYEKNGDLTPSDVVAGSNKKFWWRCDKGPDHRWESTVSSRTNGGRGCPCCSNKKVSVTNSLAALFPKVAAEWDYEKNGDLIPSDVIAGFHDKRWWRCDKGPDHRWNIPVKNRTYGGAGCPFCSGKKVSVTNSLATRFPQVAAEWDYEKNGDLTPLKVVAGSNSKRWWRCGKDLDHLWETTVNSRTYGGCGCPFCAGQRAMVSNSLITLFPEVAVQWDYEKNGDLTPSEVAAGSNRKRWWRCAKGPDHRWKTTVSSRAYGGSGCPFCAGREASVTNSLAAKFPKVAEEWDSEKNGGLTPSEVAAGSNHKCWWRCAKGPDHRWEAVVVSRTYGGRGCRFCAGREVSITNSLATLFPEVAEEWDSERNGGLTPSEVTAGSHYKRWWRCRKNPNHRWEATVEHRTRAGRGCPRCSNRHSGPEIVLACELAQFFPIDHNDSRVIDLEGHSWEVDIAIRSEKLVIEYDGAYYHTGREDQDKEKTEALNDADWRVVRIRERGLDRIQSCDLLIEPPYVNSRQEKKLKLKKMVDAVLLHLERVLRKNIPGSDDYLDQPDLTNYDKARAITYSLSESTGTGSGDSVDGVQLEMELLMSGEV